jgi:heptosyltransferase-2
MCFLSNIAHVNIFFLPMQKCAVLMPNWIGDFLLALSVVTRKQSQSSINPTLIVPENIVDLSNHISPFVTIPYKRKTKEDLRKSIDLVKAQGFEKLFILPHSFSSALFGFKTGIKSRRGISAEFRGILLTERLPKTFSSRKEHLTKEYSIVLETQYMEPGLWTGAQVNGNPDYKGKIILCPGAMYGPAKQWNGFADLVKILADKEFLILGNTSDSHTAKQIVSIAPQRVLDLTGKTTLPEAASIIASSSVVVSNDSGLMHLAGYCGTPVVCIFGSTSPLWTRPLGTKVKIASANFGCSPCYKRECGKEDYGCLKAIKAEMVALMTKEIIKDIRPPQQ